MTIRRYIAKHKDKRENKGESNLGNDTNSEVTIKAKEHTYSKIISKENESELNKSSKTNWVPCTIMEALEFLEKDHGSEELEVEKLISDTDFCETESKTKKRKCEKDANFIKIRNTYFMCMFCLNRFNSMEELMNHMNEPIPCIIPTVFRCDVCDKEFNCQSKLLTHMKTHKEKPTYYCEKCGEAFKNSNKLTNHIESMHTEYFDALGSAFQCKLCNQEFVTHDLVLQHINQIHLHISTLLCHICGKSFMNKVRLNTHIMTHKDTKSFLCQVCSKSFKTPSSLQAHIKTHDETKSFICEACGKAFKTSRSLREHTKIHVSENTYFCIICDKSFRSKFELDEHIKIHL